MPYSSFSQILINAQSNPLSLFDISNCHFQCITSRMLRGNGMGRRHFGLVSCTRLTVLNKLLGARCSDENSRFICTYSFDFNFHLQKHSHLGLGDLPFNDIATWQKRNKIFKNKVKSFKFTDGIGRVSGKHISLICKRIESSDVHNLSNESRRLPNTYL